MTEGTEVPRKEFLPTGFPDLIFGAEKHLLTLPEERKEFKRVIIEPLAREGAAYFLLSGRLLVREWEEVGYRFREFATLLVNIAGHQAVRALEDRAAQEALRELKNRGAISEPAPKNLAVRYLARRLLRWEELADAAFKITPATKDSEYLTGNQRSREQDEAIGQRIIDLLRNPPNYFLDAILGVALSQLEDDLLESSVSAKYGIHLRTAVDKAWGDTATSRRLAHIIHGEVTAAADELISGAKITQDQIFSVLSASLPLHIPMVSFLAWGEVMREFNRA